MPALDRPILLEPRRLTESWTLLPSFLPVPGLGCLAVNSFLLHGEEPLLVDTGLAALGDAWMAALEREIDPAELRWIWLSHLDADHAGNLARLLERAPEARVVTGFLGMGKLGLAGFDTGRVALLEPGAPFRAGARLLQPVRPPYYDAPETVGFLDRQDGVFFAVDSFGALLPEPVEALDAVGETALRDGLATWSAIDAPWLASTDRAAFGRTLETLRRLAPRTLLSSHLPAAPGGLGRLTRLVQDAWCAGPAAGLDPLAIERALSAAA